MIGLLSGIVGAVLSAQFFIQPGPAGPQGEQGSQGVQGIQGIPGVDGTDGILQMIQKRNDTQVSVDSYIAMQWFDLSNIDPSMEIIVNVQQDSKIFVQFSTYCMLQPPASIWIRIVVDGLYNSSKYVCSTGPPASGTYHLPGHIEFLTDGLTAGSHTVDVQFLREVGSPLILDRTLTAIEISP